MFFQSNYAQHTQKAALYKQPFLQFLFKQAAIQHLETRSGQQEELRFVNSICWHRT